MADENGIPIRFGYYEMLKTIGKGNFAVVKLARHTIINLQVAIKVISIKSLDADQIRKLNREIDIMKLVGSHKNVVRLYQVMQSDRHVMLVTEYCEGGELFEQLVTKGRLSEKNSRFYFHQIVDAVKYLHSNGIVHRDLKAENLLLTSDFKCVKLADFGFSNYYSEQSFLATWCGSPPYAAPELFEGKQYNGPKADIWSLGVVLYVLVCGSLPFDGNTLQSLKTRVLSGKFRIPYFMTRDCEHLIRHMLVIDPDKRYSLQQIKQHKWMCDINDQNSSEKLSDKLKNFHISSDANVCSDVPSGDEDIDMSLVEWIASELNVDSKIVLDSIKSRSFDQYYALYSLVNDTSHCTTLSAPPSPPLLPIVPSTNQRKSSITTGIVEREPTPTSLAPNVSNVRRHTCPDAQATDSAGTCCPSQLTAPTLFLTPPVVPATATTMAPPMSNLSLAPPNYPLAMDLLKPPPVLLLANNNMGRRASDGQANYARTHSETSTTIPGAPQGSYGNSVTANKTIQSHQTYPPINFVKRKRHSLTDTNELISRQRRLQLAQANLNAERSRRRASDGSTGGIFTNQQQISIPTLQNELRTLCVSSPPSLHTSPIHGSSISTGAGGNNQTIVHHQSHMSTSISNSSATSLPPSSPPPTLPQICEEKSSTESGHTQSPMKQQQSNKMHKSVKMSGLSMMQPHYSGSPVPLITPPQSFRSSPVTSPNHTTPSISVTDELGASQFPILPPPIDFQLVASHPSLDKDPGSPKTSPELKFNRLHRWRNDEKFPVVCSSLWSSSITPSTMSTAPQMMITGEMDRRFDHLMNFPSYPNLNFDSPSRDEFKPTTAGSILTGGGASSSSSSSLQGSTGPPNHYTSLQCVPCVINSSHLTTTDSGSICINDTKTAAKMLSKFGHDDFKINEHHILNFGQTDLQISIEWNETQQKLILKHVSGDASQYKNLCHELISTII